MKLDRLHLITLVFATGLTWSLYLLYVGVMSYENLWLYFKPFTLIVTTLTILAVSFDRCVWRFKVLHGWYVKKPGLRGTWKVELKSSYVNPETGKTIDPIRGYMAVTQTFSTLQMHLMTKESQSWLIAESINPSDRGKGYQIATVYSNRPKTELRGVRSEIHYGSFLLDTHGPDHRPTTLTGEYWTDRKTKGRMELTRCSKKVYTRFTEADKSISQDA